MGARRGEICNVFVVDAVLFGRGNGAARDAVMFGPLFVPRNEWSQICASVRSGPMSVNS
jgi:hypothetical protein